LDFLDRHSKNTKTQNFMKIFQWEPRCSRRKNRRTDRSNEILASSLFAIWRRHLKCLPSTHVVHLHIYMILRTNLHNFHKHKQRLFQYNHCFDKRLNPTPKSRAANRHVDLHVQCLLCLKPSNAKRHV
jgi:hypothetical protein